VILTVYDSTHCPMANAVITAAWSGGTSATDKCTTDTNGNCNITSLSICNSEDSVTLTVDNVSHANISYDSSANHDPDDDRNGTVIIIDSP